jgi:phosphatidylglycerophosphate synthase
MPAVRPGPVVGVIGQVALLTALATTVGVGTRGSLTGVAYAAVLCVLLTRGMHRAGARAFGPADWVTLIRATLVGAVTALAVGPLGPRAHATLVLLAAVALALDAVDGQVARRTGTVTALGARFDMEVDAFLLLVLSAYVVPLVGGWVLLIGVMRYAFVGAAAVLPWMRGSAPPRRWCKVVAAVQGVVLLIAAANLLPRPLISGALVIALALLIESFGREVVWLWQHRTVQPAIRGQELRPITVVTAGTLAHPAE